MPSDEVKEPWLFAVPDYAETVAYEMYPGQDGQDTQRDAARHMLAAGTLARKYGPAWAERLGKLHEYKTSPLAALRTFLGIGTMPPDYAQDMHNNTLGIVLGGQSRNQAHLEELIQAAAEAALKECQDGKAWINKARGGLATMKECSCHK